MTRTRIKICGLTRAEDVALAVELGADALGFVLYPGSPRFVSLAQLKGLIAAVPPFVTTVGLFVNAARDTVRAVLDEAALSLVQFHGDETPEDCVGFGVPFIRAARVTASLDLLEFKRRYHAAQAILFDANVPGFGGAGRTFDWSLIPAELAPQAVLSGGLCAQNVAEAIARVRPYAVDVSSGVERDKGVKDEQRMRDFFTAVRSADSSFRAD